MNWKKSLSMILAAVLAVSIMAFALPNGSVFAQTPTPQPKDPAAQAAKANARLEKAYQTELKNLDNQSKMFDKVTTLTSKASDLIAKAKAKGKDTSALEAGLTTFSAKISDAQKLHDAAASFLQAHAGFDANGKVVDRIVARDTVQNGHSQLQDVRQAVAQAIKNFRETIKDWRQANQPKPAPTVTPTTNS